MSRIFCFKSKIRIEPNVGGYRFCRLQCLAAQSYRNRNLCSDNNRFNWIIWVVNVRDNDKENRPIEGTFYHNDCRIVPFVCQNV